MTDAQLITIVLTLFAILGSVIFNRKSVEDMRDVLRAEWKFGVGEVRADLKVEIASLNATLKRIENKLDHYAEVQATHSERLNRLDNTRIEWVHGGNSAA